MRIYQQLTTKNSASLNKVIHAGFLKHHTNDGIRQTHLFEGRYENIYLDEKHIPELATLIDYAINQAEKILKIKDLRAGYWFNYMPPGSTTTLHTHDDDDELLSVVYYVYVPKDSGNLIIYSKNNQEKTEITPNAGEFIFFKPNVKHEVSRNNSDEHRLSIGINFGKK